MDAWIPITIAAALAQTLRFMAQKHLKSTALSTGGATLARFLYSAPLVAIGIALYANWQGFAVPSLDGAFWSYAMFGGLAQILATMCVVALFQRRNFAVGITFKKTEVMLTALAGYLILGDVVTPLAGFAVAVGFFGVIWLSDPPGGDRDGFRRFFNRAAGLGLLSGVFFAISAVGYRGAVLEVAGGDTAFRAGMTLAIVTTAQSLALGSWLLWREPGQLGAVLRNWRVAGLTGVLSMIGSFCWFAAFSLQNAAYVFALGQVELMFSIVAATVWFRERISAREAIGMVVLTMSIVMIVWAT
ncbi:DMT family transporter [Ovoidimarina sediminis]|uniref:DMT family transporter n=1 Tax=Ovoidimarina sediminis TaxID=3079856 RepID=UPI00290680D6|nr:DMT family transporter [Rhodophyticola sp. MJ-SS7]MDU8942132.1 DMT family transporter [Rhodophyticola sp. MJ-SS7]